ncbi:hypothetical protein NEH16_15235 [Streptomyces drozdowiczii]|uniref:Uncharacterized protein n=1 Tax=Streptomyces drozdowiczii TaxID=202862 RepID=A0ABY6PSP0_9ACTN|nr:hypothetical protein [Streptomyces drozdowiczii]UZK55297.1 hypothetical protein NEH16_15235 [Streptomyces drozdowiczii]
MSVGGAGIPRLQELTYIESAALAVARGETFERIRLAILDRAEALARSTDHDGSFDSAKWHRRRIDSTTYVHNTVDVLKELMRLGWVERHVLPSTPRSAYAHADVTYEVTPSGLAWTDLIQRNRLDGYNALVGALLRAHPQFDGYLRLVGARPDSTTDHLTVPLLRNDGSSAGDYERYLTAFVAHVTDACRAGDLGWTAPPKVIEESLRDYVTRAVHRADARARQRPTDNTSPADPPVTRKRFMLLCEEAAVRLAFTSAGCTMDYISHELLRRWTRFLGLANFSYYAPGPPPCGSGARAGSWARVNRWTSTARSARMSGSQSSRPSRRSGAPRTDIWTTPRTTRCGAFEQRSAGSYGSATRSSTLPSARPTAASCPTSSSGSTWTRQPS